MNSKEALENIKHAPGFMGGNRRYKSVLESRIPFLEDIEIIKQALDRLEKLEKAIKILKRNYLAVGENRNSDTGYIVSIESDITKQEYELIKEVLENE